MRGGGAPSAADGGDALTGPDPVADSDEVPFIVGIHGEEAINVLNLDHVAVAILEAACDDEPRGGGADGRTSIGFNIDAFVPAAAPQSEARSHRPLHWPQKQRQPVAEIRQLKNQVGWALGKEGLRA